VPHLIDAEDGTAHVYMLHTDLSGKTVVIFGDGVNGARLPTGRNNVVATYRSGMWPTPLAPHQLSILQTRPLGLRHSDNPLATEPGAPAEQRDASRRRLPHWMRPLGRLVTLRDFQDFVSQNTAVALALVAPPWVRGQKIVQITIAGQGGDLIARRGQTYRQLAASIEAQRAPGTPVRLMNYQPVYWTVGLRLRVGRKQDKAEVASDVRQHFERRFGFANALFGQSFYIGEMVDTALAVDGVLAAQTRRFGTVGVGWSSSPETANGLRLAGVGPFVPAGEGRIRAELAAVDQVTGAVRAAQLLVLSGVELEVTT